MSLLRNVMFACLAAAALVFTPAAQADQWQKSADGYWYFWSDNNQRWFYMDGREWKLWEDGQWVDSGSPSLQRTNSQSYSSYYADPSPGSSGRRWSYSGGGRR